MHLAKRARRRARTIAHSCMHGCTHASRTQIHATRECSTWRDGRATLTPSSGMGGRRLPRRGRGLRATERAGPPRLVFRMRKRVDGLDDYRPLAEFRREHPKHPTLLCTLSIVALVLHLRRRRRWTKPTAVADGSTTPTEQQTVEHSGSTRRPCAGSA